MTRFPELSPSDEHNERLLANVHPPEWVNPTPAERYNLVVVGAGTAGLVSAAGAAGLGARVALVERHLMGGDCLNTGCVPSKTLLRAARAVADVRQARRYGVHVPEGTRVDFAEVMERVRAVRADISPHDSAHRFSEEYGIDVFLGSGRFVGRDAVEVGDATLRFERAVIATGARAALPPVPGLAESGYETNASIFNLTVLPARLAVLGGGPIGCELAQAFARLGSHVTLLEMESTLLPRDDSDAASTVRAALERDGVDVRLATKLERVDVDGAAKQLWVRTGPDTAALSVDTLLIATGRQPNVEGLQLEVAGVRTGAAGVKVDGAFQTTNSRIYAAGDVCSPHKFTHAADFMARAVIQNAFFGFTGKKRVGQLIIPWCTYTDPEVAHVGLTEAEASDEGTEISTFTVDLADVDRAIAEGETDGFVKIHVAAGGDEIVGATVVAPHAGDLISEITTAIVGKIGLGTLASVIHPYPTQAEAIRKAGDLYNRTRLTEGRSKVLSRYFSWRR
jgi:pyruvate/2-oxoglutarate dehydrogenase complex dihydrolipoamide dehydrogenase (E3) component